MTWDGVERRRSNRETMDSFQPQGAFEGYMKASIENIYARLDRLPCIEAFVRLNKVENAVSNIQGKATVWGMIAGFIAGISISFIKWILGTK